MTATSKTIWTDESREQYFLIPKNATLADGEFLLRTATGKRWLVDEEAASAYSVSESEARNWLKSEMTSVFSELRDSFQATFEKRRRDFPEKLMQDFERRTGVSDPHKFAELLQNLGRSGEYFSERFSQRMMDLANEVVADRERTGDKKDDQA